MEKRRYAGYLYVIAYLMLLRVVLNITVGISVFNLGMFYDLVLMMFWVGAISYLIGKRKAQKAFYIFVVVVSSIITIGDSVYHDYFSIISSKTSFAGIKFLTEGQTLEYDISVPLVAYLITPILIGVIYLIIANKKKDVFVLRDFGILSLIFVAQVVLFLFWGNMEFESRVDYYRSDAFLFETMHDRTKFSEKYGYYNYHILDVTRLRKAADDEADVTLIDAYFDELEPHTTNDMSDLYKDYNVITILAESLDTRFIDETLTPNLYMMQQDGYSFDNYFTPVFQQGATCNSEYMSLTGLESISSNDWSNNVCDAYSNNSFPYSLPAQLNTIGYKTYYFHSGYEWFYNRLEMIPSYGFDTVKFQEDIYALGYDDFEERYDRDMMYFMDEYVDYSDLFYVNLLTYSGHGAYNQTDFDKYSDRINQAYPNQEFDYQIINYMEKAVELDMMIGDIITELEANGVMDNTLIAIYPDHYPYMLTTDLYEDHVGVDITDKEIHRQELLIYTPNMTPQVVHTAGSTVDITPTLLNMLDSSLNFDYFMGTDLFGTDENFIIFNDLTITNGSTFLDMDEVYIGPVVDHAYFERILEIEIETLEIQKKLLETDYFRK